MGDGEVTSVAVHDGTGGAGSAASSTRLVAATARLVKLLAQPPHRNRSLLHESSWIKQGKRPGLQNSEDCGSLSKTQPFHN